MSTSGSLSGINFSGIASGIDTQSIIQKLISIQQIPVTNMQSQQATLQAQQIIYGQLGGVLTNLSSAANGLTSANSFNPIAATSSDTSVATITGSNSASPGVYNLSVTALAQAEKIASAAQVDTTSGLNLTGAFVVNGSTVNVVATDSLTSIAQKINSLNAGVTASLINGGSNSAYLTLTSNNSGLANKVQVADTSGGVLGSLGMLSGAATIRQSVANGADSFAFNSSTSSIGTLLGNPNLGSSTIQINGVDVTINGSDSLQQIATNISGAGAGVTATVKTTTAPPPGNPNGTPVTTYSLEITGNAGTPTFTDSNNVLQSLGVLQQSFGSELVKAQDAQYSLDGVNLTSASNTITSAIPGATLTLLKGTVATPGTSTLALTTDSNAVNSSITSFVNAYNNVVDFISQNSQLDSTTFNSGPLFADPVAEQVSNSLSNQLFQNVSGLTGQYTNLASIGFSIDQNNHLVVDNGVLSNAMSSNPSAVKAIFDAQGSGSDSNISFVSNTSKTKPSGQIPYAVNISQLATEGSYTGETAQTTANANAETLTFNGSLFSSTPYTFMLSAGNDATANMNQINGDATLKNLVTASLDTNGNLVITSKRYGTQGNFTVVSDTAAGTDNSGIGTGSLGTTVTGLDVAGTINGEAATGAGQFLTGNSGNANTDGLQIQYTGTATGDVGTVSFSKGIASQVSDLMTGFTDSVSGLLTASNKALQNQIDGLTTDISNLQAQIAQNQTLLEQQYSAMENAIAALQNQAGQLSALTGLSTNNTTKTPTTG